MARVTSLEEAQGVARAHGHVIIETDASPSDRRHHFSCQNQECQAWFDVDPFDDTVKGEFGLNHSCPTRGKTYAP